MKWKLDSHKHKPPSQWHLRDEYGCTVAIVLGTPEGELKPIADLIAAAPDLLEALEYAITTVPELATVPGVAAAIAKAKGE